MKDDTLILAEKLDRIYTLLKGQKEMMTLDDVATYTELSKSTIYKLTARNEIPHYKPTGKVIFFKKSEIDAWLLTDSQNKPKSDVVLQLEAKRYVAESIGR